MISIFGQRTLTPHVQPPYFIGGTVGWATGRAGQVGRQGVEGDCADVLAAKTDGNLPVWRAFGHKTLAEAPCFCFLFRGPGPSEAASGRPLNERSKTLRPGPL